MDVIGKMVELLDEFYGCDTMYYGVDADGAVTIDHDDAEQIWALLLDYKDLLMAKEVE